MFPCAACDKVFVNEGLLKMHVGRFHTDRSAPRDWGNSDEGNNNGVDYRSEGDRQSCTSKERRVAQDRESSSSVHEGRGGEHLGNNREELPGRRGGVARSSSSSAYRNFGVGSNETSDVQKSRGPWNSTSQRRETDGGMGMSSFRGGRSESPADSVWRYGGLLCQQER